MRTHPSTFPHNLFPFKLFQKNSFSDYKSVEYNHVKVLDYLEAKRASFDKVTCKVMECQNNADIGYHFKLKDPDAMDEYDEGDVVGFFKDEEGKSVIDLLDNNNANDAFMAGVISRSAYLEARQSLQEGNMTVVYLYIPLPFLMWFCQTKPFSFENNMSYNNLCCDPPIKV
jgi:predicted metal-dependent phosphotriesterase family hydrolase